ncbi:MAG: T9SS type A sorting domain-containing protein [Bacteroidales bacterium]|nr:T9SS type A sorting domain-containing protein [Bacteroidales bacterium]
MNRLLSVIAAAALATVSAAGQAIAQDTEPDPQLPESLPLPFFDDFSSLESQPDAKLWEMHGASINTNIPYLPPSTGAVLMDALDNNGNFYPAARYGAQTKADTLESKAINLDYPSDQTIYLSYFYQRGGLGDQPEAADSLVLEFYSPTERKWFTQKQYEGGRCEPFAQEMIQISDRKFLQDGFRFRFRNYISLGSQLAPDLVSNCDYWLIDYVHLDRNRDEYDTQYADVALTAWPQIKFGDYQQIPWSHYTTGRPIKNNYTINYRNNDNRARLLDSINLYLSHDGITDTLKLGSYNIPAEMDFENHNPEFKYSYQSADPTSASYQIEARLVSDASQTDYAPNNSLKITKTLSDYYAYDDGTAEAAYGLHGEGSSGGRVAVRFCPLKTDYINGISIYFCPVFQNRQASSMNLKIWSCNNGVPGSEIYTVDNVQVPKNKTGEFMFVPLNDLVEVQDTFFVGWEKTENAIIAAGFDKNSTSCNPKFYNIGGKWKQSSEKGQIMIRPSFGNLKTATGDLLPENIKEVILPKIHKLTIYPNPASEYIRIKAESAPGTIHIIDMAGHNVRTINPQTLNNEIPIDDLIPGTYIIYAPLLRASAKFIKTN